MTTIGLQCDPGHATGEVQVRLHDGQPSFDIVDARAYDHICAGQLPSFDVSIVYHGSLALRHPRSAAALDALLDASGAPVFLDVNLREPWWNADALARRLSRARWVKLNHHELGVLDDAPGDAATRAARLLERHDLEAIIVTLGDEGAFVLERSGACVRAPATRVREVVDTVGAGDAFAAICMLGLLGRWPLATLVERAQHFAARVVAQRGATAEAPALYRALVDGWDRSRRRTR
jgi:fructokinase